MSNEKITKEDIENVRQFLAELGTELARWFESIAGPLKQQAPIIPHINIPHIVPLLPPPGDDTIGRVVGARMMEDDVYDAE